MAGSQSWTVKADSFFPQPKLKQSLAVTVWDHDKLKQNDYIGINF
jgi:hypothetical protein